MQPRGIVERDHVARTREHALGDHRLCDRFSGGVHQDNDGNGRRYLVPDTYRRLQFDAARGHMHQQLRVDLSQRIAQVAQLGNPRAVSRESRAAQNAVDRLDGIARGAQYDERDRILLGQGDSRDSVRGDTILAPGRCCPACAASHLWTVRPARIGVARAPLPVRPAPHGRGGGRGSPAGAP